MIFKRKDRSGTFKNTLLVVIGALIIIAGGWLLLTRLEGKPPRISIELKSSILPSQTEINGQVSDPESGLSKLRITLLKDGKETVLLEKNFTKTHAAPFQISINTGQLGISDGGARLRMAAWDHSWRHWWKGNRTYVEKEIVFDSTPPAVSVLSTAHNVVPGGAGLVIYRLSEPCETSGAVAGPEFFPGYAGHFDDPQVYMAFFALGYDQGRGTDLYVKALDAAGNSAKASFYYHIRKKSFKTDTISISDGFLAAILPEFHSAEGFPAAAAPVDQFLFINNSLRRQNNEVILGTGRKTDAMLYWADEFLRMPNSAPRAGFADQRQYQYNGDIIDRAVHLGVDLASLKHAEVPAANRGKVVFTGPVGIYGNLVCIDHGYGLVSIYGHLSQIKVTPGQMVEKGAVIGLTGETGLAGGDHLHFGIFVDHVFVNPLEWWDAEWIKNNITSKIHDVEAVLKQEAE